MGNGLVPKGYFHYPKEDPSRIVYLPSVVEKGAGWGSPPLQQCCAMKSNRVNPVCALHDFTFQCSLGLGRVLARSNKLGGGGNSYPVTSAETIISITSTCYLLDKK